MGSRYSDFRVLACGGMAEISLARERRDDGTERSVVIKRVLRHLADEREFIDMFETEARLALQLKHPNIVEVIDAGREQGLPFIVMEPLVGADLRTLLRAVVARSGRVTPAIACIIAGNVARGLHYAHTLRSSAGKPLGVVHRDVSPHNVFVTAAGEVKVLDFGIARSAEQLTVTRTGVFKGKLGYAAPEQLEGLRIDTRTDLYALGVVLWEMLAGRRLWRAPSEAALLRRMLEESPATPSTVAAGVPPMLDALTMSLLARLTASRPANAEVVAIAFDRLARELGVTDPRTAIANWCLDLMPHGAAPSLAVDPTTRTEISAPPVFADELDGDAEDTGSSAHVRSPVPAASFPADADQNAAVVATRGPRISKLLAASALIAALLVAGVFASVTWRSPARHKQSGAVPAFAEPLESAVVTAPVTASVHHETVATNPVAPVPENRAQVAASPPPRSAAATVTVRHAHPGSHAARRGSTTRVLSGGAIREFP